MALDAGAGLDGRDALLLVAHKVDFVALGVDDGHEASAGAVLRVGEGRFDVAAQGVFGRHVLTVAVEDEEFPRRWPPDRVL